VVGNPNETAIILQAEAAIIIIIVPATAAIKAFLAKPSFSGAPWAVKNNIPVIIQKIITHPIATGQATFVTTLLVIAPMVWAPVKVGTKTTAKRTKDSIFIFFMLISNEI